LDQGLKPWDMKISIEGILHRTEPTEDADVLEEVKLDNLSLEEED
jgi:hypothetical protein